MARSKKFVLTNKITGKQIQLGGCLPVETKPPQAKKYFGERFRASELPPRVDLRAYLKQVEDQGEIKGCSANAVTSAWEYLLNRSFKEEQKLSRLFVYYNARALSGEEDYDSGSSIASNIQVLSRTGVCREATWPYDPEMVTERPHPEAYQEAKNFLLPGAAELEADLYTCKHCLAEGYPFAFSANIFRSFAEASHKGRVPLPEPEEEEEVLGQQALLCVGYSENSQAFIARNCWGEEWGDRGYCYLPYGYLTNPDFCSDFWTIYPGSKEDLSSGVWFEEDKDFYGQKEFFYSEYEYEYYYEGEEGEDYYLSEEEEEDYPYDYEFDPEEKKKVVEEELPEYSLPEEDYEELPEYEIEDDSEEGEEEEYDYDLLDELGDLAEGYLDDFEDEED